MRRKFMWSLTAAVLMAAIALPGSSTASGATTSSSPLRVSYFKNYTGYCLDGYLAHGPFMNNTCNHGVFQRWLWNTTPGIKTPIVSMGEQSYGKRWCLSGYGSDVYFSECNATAPYQRWQMIYPASGGFLIHHPTSGRCLAHRAPFPQTQEVSLEPCRWDYGNLRWLRYDVS